jgi:hypothetical protein
MATRRRPLDRPTDRPSLRGTSHTCWEAIEAPSHQPRASRLVGAPAWSPRWCRISLQRVATRFGVRKRRRNPLARAETSCTWRRDAAGAAAKAVRRGTPRRPNRPPNCAKPCKSNGPGRDRTCDLGIKSPAQQAATSCRPLKRAATGANDPCNEPQRIAACGDKPVRTSYARFVRSTDNEERRPAMSLDDAHKGPGRRALADCRCEPCLGAVGAARLNRSERALYATALAASKTANPRPAFRNSSARTARYLASPPPAAPRVQPRSPRSRGAVAL